MLIVLRDSPLEEDIRFASLRPSSKKSRAKETQQRAGEIILLAVIIMVRCAAITNTGEQCKMNTKIRFPYCWIHLKSKDKLAVKPSTIADAGKGLFYVGKEAVRKDTNIAKYSGVQTAVPDPMSDYVVAISKNKFLDAKSPLSAVGRYINDARGHTRPNVVLSGTRTFTPYYGQPSINVRTLKTIRPNTELFLSYGRDYWA